MRTPPAVLLRASRPLAVAVAAGCALVAGLAAAPVLAATPPEQVLHSVDRGLCPFGLGVTVTRTVRMRRAAGHVLRVVGPTRIVLRNLLTGRAAVLVASGSASTDLGSGSVTFTGRQIWLAAESNVPYLSTDGPGGRAAPSFLLVGGSRPQVIDPCALVAPASPPGPVEGPAPWGVPPFALSRMAGAGLTPVIGGLRRHDHVHLDVIVDGRRLTIPAGVGVAEPFDAGPGRCPRPPDPPLGGDCASGHFFGARVALSPLHLHTTSGIVHIESDRAGTFTLGQVFDVWGVRFGAGCLGGYCAGAGNDLRVYVDGKRVTGDPRAVVLGNAQEIAVVFGPPSGFRDVPRSYAGRLPVGCGGRGEHSCNP